MFLLSVIYDILEDLNITYIVLGSGFGLGILIYTLRFLIADRNPTALRRPRHEYKIDTARTQSALESSELEAPDSDNGLPSSAREGVGSVLDLPEGDEELSSEKIESAFDGVLFTNMPKFPGSINVRRVTKKAGEEAR